MRFACNLIIEPPLEKFCIRHLYNANGGGGIQDYRKGGQTTMCAQSALAKFLAMPTNRLTTPCDREAIHSFLTIKCSISTELLR